MLKTITLFKKSLLRLTKKGRWPQVFLVTYLTWVTPLTTYAESSKSESESSTDGFKQNLMVQLLTNNLNTRDDSQIVQTAYNRLSLNFEGTFQNKALFLIELEQFQNQFDRNLEINQFFVESIQAFDTASWVWGLGYMPIPISKLNNLDDQLFLSTPNYHRDFFAEDRQLIESGIYGGYQKNGFQIRGGIFQRIKSSSASTVPQYAELAPHFIQVKKLLEEGEIGMTYYAEKTANLPKRESWGFHSYLTWHKHIVWDFESWLHNRSFHDLNIEQSMGGYSYLGLFLWDQKWELGVRLDFLQRLNLKDAWGNRVANISFNPAPISRVALLPELYLQLEHISEQQVVSNIQQLGLTGWLLQVSYSAQF